MVTNICIIMIPIVLIPIMIGFLHLITKKDDEKVMASKDIIFSFEAPCKDQLEELIEFSKCNPSNYRI